MRRLLALCAMAMAIIITSTSVASALEGGLKDPVSGLVWSCSQTTINGSDLSWTSSSTFAFNYTCYDVNAQGVPTTYSDWRLPTLAELTVAVNRGTIQTINYANGFKAPAGKTVTMHFWTADNKGSNATAMGLTVNDQGTIIGATSKQLAKKTLICGGYMVRP